MFWDNSNNMTMGSEQQQKVAMESPWVSTCMVGPCSVNVVVFRWAFTSLILRSSVFDHFYYAIQSGTLGHQDRLGMVSNQEPRHSYLWYGCVQELEAGIFTRWCQYSLLFNALNKSKFLGYCKFLELCNTMHHFVPYSLKCLDTDVTRQSFIALRKVLNTN